MSLYLLMDCCHCFAVSNVLLKVVVVVVAVVGVVVAVVVVAAAVAVVVAVAVGVAVGVGVMMSSGPMAILSGEQAMTSYCQTHFRHCVDD